MRLRPSVPFFSIVIPTYNRATDLRLALFCLLRQTFDNIEVIVCDNASIDDTPSVVAAFKDKRIRYVRNEKTISMIDNQAKAIKLARGRYVFLHGDDDFLPYRTSFTEIYKEIKKRMPGYVRLNYASLAFDRKHLFTYVVNKPYVRNEYLSPSASLRETLSFIVNSDHYFFTGILFRNEMPKRIHMVQADPAPWISILFYMTRTYGACFIAKRHVVALWSRRIKKKEDHNFYGMQKGKLKAEGYFQQVKKLIPSFLYKEFLHRELMTIYVNLLPAIKVNVGHTTMMRVVKRIKTLDPTIPAERTYQLLFGLTAILPRCILEGIRNVYLYVYMRRQKIADEQKLVRAMKMVERDYGASLFSLP